MTTSARPFYTVQLEIGGVAWEARVNDAPLFTEMRGFNTATELPLNRWIRNGTNHFSLHMRPRPGQDHIPVENHPVAVVYVRELGANRQSRREVWRLDSVAHATDRGGVTVAEDTFQAEVPYSPFLWFASEAIGETEETRLELARETGRFHQWLASRDLEAIVRAAAARDREDAGAIYRSLEEQVENTRNTYRHFFNGADYELRPARTDTAHLRIYGEGRLARLELSNGKPPLQYRTGSNGIVAYLPLLFCRYQGSWTIIR